MSCSTRETAEENQASILDGNVVFQTLYQLHIEQKSGNRAQVLFLGCDDWHGKSWKV